MVFSADTVLGSKNKSVSTLIQEEVLENDGQMIDEALDLISKEDIYFNEFFKDDIIEGIKEFDFSTILSKVFDVFVSALGRLASSFGAFLLNFVNKDAQLKVLKGQLANYRGSVRYTKPYYTYTHIEANTMPTVEYKRQIDQVWVNFMNTINGLANVTDSEELRASLEKNIPDMGETLDKIRGSLCGQPAVNEASFRDELFRYFRNGEMNRTTDKVKMFDKNIDGNRIAVAYRDFYNSNKQIASINRENFRYKAEATAAKAKIITYKPLFVLKKAGLNGAAIVSYNRLVSAHCKEIRSICDTYVMFFAAKIDALREYNRTNKEILLLAAKQMVRDSGNND